MPGEIAEYYSEGDYMLRVVVSDRIIFYLNAEQVQALKSVG